MAPLASLHERLPVCLPACLPARLSGVCTAAPDGGAADGRRPRVCILGGGFGGAYTAIKLELLMWPQGKKPQVCERAPLSFQPQLLAAWPCFSVRPAGSATHATRATLHTTQPPSCFCS